MTTFLLILHVLFVLIMIGLILMQKTESGGILGSGGAMKGLLNPRGSANFMTRATAMMAGGFMLTSLLLAFVESQKNRHASSLFEEESVLSQNAPSVPSAPTASEQAVPPAVDSKPVPEAPSAPAS